MEGPETKMAREGSKKMELKLSTDRSEYLKDELDPEKQQIDSPSSLSPTGGVGPHDEIAWHYLTFDTDLPPPAHTAQSHTALDDRKPPPECPNLKKYTNPLLWSKSRKRFMSWFGCIATMSAAYAAGSYAVVVDQVTKDWNISAPAFNVGIAVFTCGFAAGPMFLAPFSEINGRRPVFMVAGFLVMMFQLTCALTPNFGGMLAARFLLGVAASTFSTMVGGVIADFYEAKDRNWAMAVFSGGSIFGTGLGPLCSGFIAQHLYWRWVFRVQVIYNFIVLVVLVIGFKESRGHIVLTRKAICLNKWYDRMESAGYYGVLMPPDNSDKGTTTVPQRIRWKVKAHEERPAVFEMLKISLSRPFKLLFTEPVVFFFSLWITFAWSCLYLLFSAIPLIFQTRYGFDIAQTGAVFAVISIASMISTFISIYQEPWGRRYLPDKWQPFLASPEGRLMYCCIQSFLLPAGAFWYGWGSISSSIPWIVPALGIGCSTMGIFSIYLAVFNYLAEIYGTYASSALAAQSFCRNMACGSFTIFVDAMFRAMTFQGAGSFIGGVSLVLTVVPFMLVFYGPRIRARSPIASELLEKTNPN